MEACNLCLIVLSGVIMWISHKYIRNKLLQNEAKARIAKSRALAEKQRRELRKLLSSDDSASKKRSDILNLPISELLTKLKKGTLKPVEVLQAFQSKALDCTERKNCVCLFIDEARNRALELEKIPERDRGPLYGLPISVKECYIIEGYCATGGLSGRLEKPEPEDGAFIKMIKDLGGIPFCLTNVPQTMETFGCSNPVYGVTLHPSDDKRTPGGSSGGEACLLAMGGSIMGLGSDGGGSLRDPAHFCGIATIKATGGRVIRRGKFGGQKGVPPGIKSNAGFMCQTVEGVVIGMRAMLTDPWKMAKLDFTVHPLPWDEAEFSSQKKLTVGWFDFDGFFEAVPACKRAVHEAVDLFKGAGHKVVNFSTAKNYLSKIVPYYFECTMSDGGTGSLELLEGDLIDDIISLNTNVRRTPQFIKRHILPLILRWKSPLTAKIAPMGAIKSAELWTLVDDLDHLIVGFLREWDKLGLDVVISPGFACAAPLKDDPVDILPAFSYLSAHNMTDLPAGIVPVTKVHAKDQELLATGYPSNADDASDSVYQKVKKTMADAGGLPVGVQIIGKHFREETVLRAMTELENLTQTK